MTPREMFSDPVAGPILTVLLTLLAGCLVVLAALLLVGISTKALNAAIESAKQERATFASLTGKTIASIGRDPKDDDSVIATFTDGSSLLLHARGYKGADLDAAFEGVAR